MYHPTTRVLSILELLQAYPGLNGKQLAERLEVDRRTVRRYIAMLEDLGIPIEAQRGPYGGYRLQPSFKLPPLMLNDDEALAVTLSLLAAHSGVPVDEHSIAGALAKLERVLPPAVRARMEAVQALVSFGPADAIPQPSAGLLLQLSEAAHQRRRVRLRYLSSSGDTQRDFDVYGVLRHWNRWYSIGWCHLRHAQRVLRLDRIVACELLAESFSAPAHFDALNELLAALENAPALWQAEVLLETDIDTVAWRFAPGSATLEQTADGVVLRIFVDRLDWLARQLMLLECPFIVRHPTELRAALRELAAEALAQAGRNK